MGATEWRSYYRVSAPNSVLEARRSPGGEPYGKENFGLLTQPNQWLCRNPSNGYCWVCSDEAFEQLYQEVGKYRMVEKTGDKRLRVGSVRRKR